MYNCILGIVSVISKINLFFLILQTCNELFNENKSRCKTAKNEKCLRMVIAFLVEMPKAHNFIVSFYHFKLFLSYFFILTHTHTHTLLSISVVLLNAMLSLFAHSFPF